MGQNSLIPWENNNLNFRLARDQVMHLETTANLCSRRPDVKAIEEGQRFSLETAFIEKRFIKKAFIKKGYIIAKNRLIKGKI